MKALAILCLLLFLSGAAGLSYEVVWLRLLSNVIGCSAAATSATLAVFMLGMALGSLLLGCKADDRRRPLLWYAVLEALIGLCALLLPAALTLVKTVDARASLHLSPSMLLIVRTALSSAILLLPTFLMGGTLPAVAAHWSRRSGSGAGFSFLYGVHVVGASAGTLLSSFVLIPGLGLSLTSQAGALVNGLVAAVAAVVATRTRGSFSNAVVNPPEIAGASQGLSGSRLFLATAFLSGLVLLGAEVIFVRTLVMSLSAKVHSFALMLCVFLLALSLGSFIAGRIPAHRMNRAGTMALILGLSALGILAAREAPLRLAQPIMVKAFAAGGVTAGEYLGISLLLSLVSLVPLAVPMGVVLPLTLRVLGFQGRTGSNVGRVLFFNTVGSVLGPLAATYLLVEHLGLQGSLYALAVLVLSFAFLWLLQGFEEDAPARPVAAIVTVALAIGGIVLSPPRIGGTPRLDCTLFGKAELLGVAAPRIDHHREGATATVSVVSEGGDRRQIRLDGFEAAGTPESGRQRYQYMRFMAYLPSLLCPRDRLEHGLVICCGTGTTAGTLLQVVGEVELVDLHPEVLECLPWFEDVNRRLHQEPRCVKIADDGRAHLRRREDHYDVITLEPMPPQHAGMTQLYSVEFYEDCRRALKPGGVVCQWLPYHLVSREQALWITKAMAEVFRTVQVWEHRKTGILIGSNGAELEIRESRLAEWLESPELRRDFEELQILDLEDLVLDYLCDARDLAAELQDVDSIRDDRPSLEYGEVGYGLSLRTAEEEAAVREPFVRARMGARPPLSDAGAEHMAIALEFRAVSVSGYVSYLEHLSRFEEALELIRAEVETDPRLADHPSIRAARAALERATKRGGP